MKRFVAAVALASAIWIAPAAVADPLVLAQLKTMVTDMGYEPKDLPKTDGTAVTKFEITVATDDFTVPLGIEITPSARFIWCTANLGKSAVTGDVALEMLKRGGSIQPTSFWITSQGRLMVGMSIDNRDVTPAYLRFVFDKIAKDVSSTAELWQDVTTE